VEARPSRVFARSGAEPSSKSGEEWEFWFSVLKESVTLTEPERPASAPIIRRFNSESFQHRLQRRALDPQPAGSPVRTPRHTTGLWQNAHDVLAWHFREVVVRDFFRRIQFHRRRGNMMERMVILSQGRVPP